MKSSAKIMVISGNKKISDFMQCADVFEKSKFYGIINTFVVEYKENEKVTLKRAGKLIEATRKALEEEEVVSFVHLVEVTNGNITIKNQGEIIPYFNKEVRCVSDGYNWFVFSKFIEEITGLKVVTNEHMFVVGVGVDAGLKGIKIEKTI